MNASLSLRLEMSGRLRWGLTWAIDRDASWKSFGFAMVKDVQTEFFYLLQKIGLDLIFLQCLQLGELFPLSGWVEDKTLLLWKELPNTESGQVVFFSFFADTSGNNFSKGG